MIAQQPSSAPAVASQPPPPLRGPIGSIVGVRPCLPPPKAATAAIPPPSARPELAQLPQPRLYPGPAAQGVPAGLPSPQPAQAPGPTRGEQIKTILAAIGVLALLLHSLRILGAATKT
jgi:hypothetical protein